MCQQSKLNDIEEYLNILKIIAGTRENEQSVIQTLTIAMLFPLSKI